MARLTERIANPPPGDCFCIVPFFHLYNDNAGRWRLCCRAAPFDHTVSDTTPTAHFNHPLMEQARHEMLQNQRGVIEKLCAKCWRMEKHGLLSPRQQMNAKLLQHRGDNGHPKLRVAAQAWSENTGHLSSDERCLELKLRIFSNYCNLRCYMCAPINSTSRINELEKIRDGHWLRRMTVPDRFGFFDDSAGYDRFVDDIVGLLPRVEKIRITGGEPFLLKPHYDFLEKVIASGHAGEIGLVYDTNMTAFELGERRIMDYLTKFKRVTLFCSIDNLGAKNDYIRCGSNFHKVVANIERVRRIPNIQVAVNSSTGILNAGDVIEVADFFESLDLGTDFGMCVVEKPTFLQARHLPDRLKARYIERIEKSRHRTKFEGLLRMLRSPRDEAEFQTCLEYLGDLDRQRGSNFLALWPEFEPYVARQKAAA